MKEKETNLVPGKEYIWTSEFDKKTKIVVKFIRDIDEEYCEVLSLKDLQVYRTKKYKIKEIDEALSKNISSN